MPTEELSPQAEFVQVALQRAADPALADLPESLVLRTVQAMVRDCLRSGVAGPALIAATDAACWTSDRPANIQGN